MLTSAAMRVALALSLAANGDENCRPGSWCETPVSADTTALLLQALSDRKNYAATIHKPVCVRDVLRVHQQVVAGVNYRFDVNACPVDFADSPRALGACAGAYAGCRVAPFEIRVFSQPWTGTLRVESIAWLD